MIYKKILNIASAAYLKRISDRSNQLNELLFPVPARLSTLNSQLSIIFTIMLATILTVIYGAIVLLTCIKIIWDTRNTTKALAYLLFCVFVPVAGIIFYFFFGNNIRKNKMYSKKLINDSSVYNHLQEVMISEANRVYTSGHPIIRKNKELARLLLHDRSPLTAGNHVKLLRNGEEKFKWLLNDLMFARKSIHLEYYIWEEDDFTRKVHDILLKKAAEGIDIKIVYDDWGSKDIRKKYVRSLKQAGIEAHPFNKVKIIILANRINYRNHRKIAIIDGRISYVGGINMSNRYINYPNKEKLYWRDTHVRIAGPAINYLQYLFLCDYNFSAGCTTPLKRDYFYLEPPAAPEQSVVQIAASGPDSDTPMILYSIMQMINLATKEILITTPYMIPNEGSLDALKVQALSGVKVTLLLPYDSDSKLVNYCSRSYYTELMTAGVRIFLYKKGFIHAKTMVVDGIIAKIGTANFDMRSFDMNFEVNAIIYDRQVANELKMHFQLDLLDAEELRLSEWVRRPRMQKFKERVARLFSPLL